MSDAEIDRICDEAEKWEDRDYLTDAEIAEILDMENAA